MAPCPCHLQTQVHQPPSDARPRQFPMRIQQHCLARLHFFCHSFRLSWSLPDVHCPCKPPAAALSISQRRQLKARTCCLALSRPSGIQSAPRRRIHNAALQQGQWSRGRRIYFAFEPAFFLRSAQRFFINSDSFLRPAALSLLTRFAFGAFAVTARLGCRFGCAATSDPLRILRADVSLAISASSSLIILAVST